MAVIAAVAIAAINVAAMPATAIVTVARVGRPSWRDSSATR
jgi:hypothetical protein